ncbi:MAG: Uma2 family endonuclease [Verrucomicrobia bacterium]|nr:Uma2 family endonuclease [Verrucomicrobiota bacterium]
MSATATSRPFAEQHALNRRVWEGLAGDPKWNDVLEKVETDRDGNLIMSPPPRTRHRVRQQRISTLLNRLLPEGGSFTEGAVSTHQGTKVADVVWYPGDRAGKIEDDDVALPDFPPDLCAGVQSPRDKVADFEKKVVAYLDADVREVWLCDLKGKMSFYSPQGLLARSALCPGFPDEIPAKSLR